MSFLILSLVRKSHNQSDEALIDGFIISMFVIPIIKDGLTMPVFTAIIEIKTPPYTVDHR